MSPAKQHAPESVADDVLADDPEAWRRRDTIIVVGLTLAFLVVRLVLLDADPPAQLPQGRGPWELLREGAAKAHEARNWALTGSWSTNEVDNYQFWRAQSPLWVYPLAGFFEAFGVGLVQLRIFSVLTAALGFVGFMGVAALRFRGWSLGMAGAFFALNFYAILYTRAGLLEPLVNACWAFAVWALVLAWRRPVWLVPAHLALLSALLVKMTGAMLVPVFLVATIVVCRRAVRDGGERDRRDVRLVVAGIAVMLAITLWHVTRPDFLRALAWNFGHYFGAGEGQQALSVEAVEGVSLWDRITEPKRYWLRGLALFPIFGVLGLLGLKDAVVAWRARRFDPWTTIVAAWLMLAILSVLLGGAQGLRYRLVLFPPAALLAALAFEGLAASRTGGERRKMAAMLLGAFALLHGYWYGAWALQPTYQVRNLNRVVPTMIGDDAVVIGVWAPWLVFDSPATFYYVKPSFNSSREALHDLGVTHLLLRPIQDPTRDILNEHFPERMRDLEPTQRWTLVDEEVALYELEGGL